MLARLEVCSSETNLHEGSDNPLDARRAGYISVKTMSRGKLIVIEGLDRAGKSLQCTKLVANLQKEGRKVAKMNFPDRSTAIGKIINEYLANAKSEISDEAIHLLFSANRWEAKSKINKLLDEGVSLVVDRYCYSGIAFSAAKGMDFDWCRSCDVGLPKPDLVIFLDVDEKTASQRGGYGEERYETKEMQQKVRAQFNKLREPEWAWISANGSIDEVEAAISAVVSTVYSKGMQ